jgi:hypothetical protein
VQQELEELQVEVQAESGQIEAGDLVMFVSMIIRPIFEC